MDALGTLPLVLAVVLVELAVGGAFLVWLLDRRGEAPGGFLKLTTAVDALAAAAAVGLVPALPRGDLAIKLSLDTGPLASFGQALVVVAVVAVAHLVSAFIPSRSFRNIVGAIAIVAGVVALLVA